MDLLNDPKAPEDPLQPFQSLLGHLENHLQRVSLLIAAHLSRQPVQGKSRGRDEHLAEIDRLARFSRAEPTSAATEYWRQADALLARIEAREALTTIDLPLRRLVLRFGLSPAERDILLIAAASQLDPCFRHHFESADVDIAPPSIGTVLSILARRFEDGVTMRRLFALESPLNSNSLIVAKPYRFSAAEFFEMSVDVPRRVVGELLGDCSVAEELALFSRITAPSVGLEAVVLPAETKAIVLSLVKNHERFLELRAAWGLNEVVTYGRGLVLLFAGPPGTGKSLTAHAVAHELGRSIFSVDLAKLVDGGRDIDTNLDGIFREAKLSNAVILFDECEQVFASRRLGNQALPQLLTRLETFDGIALMATNMSHTLDAAIARRVVAQINFTQPTARTRLEIWRRHLPATVPLAEDVDLPALAERYELSGGLIKNAVLTAVLRAASCGSELLRRADLEHGARLQLRVAEDVESALSVPEVDMDSVVLPQDLRARLDRFVLASRMGPTVRSDWGLGKVLGRNSATIALLNGPSGTGKSMTAEAIAKALDRPLLRCSLPSTISKYVGETSKNLARLFDTALQHRAVLVFDEADALFARRVDVASSQDRFANAETASLLSQLDHHDGVVILTTNLAGSLDPAFERRLSLRVIFPMPDLQARTTLWRRLLSSDAPLAADIDPLRLACLYELSGAAIRNAMLQAALEAASATERRQISQAMLERAAAEQARPRAVPFVLS